MKIDIIIAVAERGGVENVINRTAAYLQQKKHTVRVVQMVWEGVEWVEQGVAHFPLLYGREGHSLEEFAEKYLGFLEREGMPEIILAAAWPYMSYVAKAAVLQKRARIPVVSWLHAPVERYQAAGYGGYESLWYADAHFAISGSIQNAICRHGGKTVYRVYNPVDFSDFAGIESEKERRETGLLFYVGRISPEKHLEVIIKALAMTRQIWELSIVGTGEEILERSLEREAERLGVAERIRWLGWQKKPWRYAAIADAVVLASEYEGVPLTVIEALACGRTVISTPVEGVKELIVPGKTGYLFGFGDSGMLAEILDAMSSGVLEPMLPGVCKEAVACYESGHALQDFERKLKNCLNEEEDMIEKKSFNQEWEEVHYLQAWGKYPAEHVIRFVARNYYKLNRKEVKILDFGCGAGAHSWYLAREGFDVYAFDGSESAIRRAKERFEKEHLNAHFEVTDALDVDYSDNYFDAVIDNVCIYGNLMENINKMYANVYRMLKPEGRLLTTCFGKKTEGYGTGEELEKDTYVHITEGALVGRGTTHFFDEKELKKVLQHAGFCNIEIDTILYTDRHIQIEQYIATAVK